MVQARADFLAVGHFASLADDLARAADEVAGSGRVPGCLVDVGAGTGYYLGAVLGRLPERAGLALDISKFAVRKAARAHPRIGAVACDAWRRPTAWHTEPAALAARIRQLPDPAPVTVAVTVSGFRAAGGRRSARAGYHASISGGSSDSRWMTASGRAPS